MYGSVLLGELLWSSVGTLGDVSTLLSCGWGSPTCDPGGRPLGGVGRVGAGAALRGLPWLSLTSPFLPLLGVRR